MKSEHEKATELHAKLAEIVSGELAKTVPVICTDRHIPRKEQAKLARKLFKILGIRGVSVRTPNYSMARVVDVRLPQLGDDVEREARRKANWEARCRMKDVLEFAFPCHDDRSDPMTDYFDHCWSID